MFRNHSGQFCQIYVTCASWNGLAYAVWKIEKSTVHYGKIKKNMFYNNNFLTIKSWLWKLGDSESYGPELSTDI